MSVLLESDEIYENEKEESYPSISPAKLNMDHEEWCYLVQTDPSLATQVGIYLLERAKDLEMIITSTDTCLEEQTARADHYEKHILYLRETIESQAKAYETFEKQVEELTTNYREISEECRQYKENNKSLWFSVESLEKTCEEYLSEIQSLKTKENLNKDEVNSNTLHPNYARPTNTNELYGKITEHDEIFDESEIISLRVFCEDTTRKLEIERSQRINLANKLQKSNSNNNDLKNQILWLEHRLKNEKHDFSGQLLTTSNLLKSKSMLTLDKEHIEISDQPTIDVYEVQNKQEESHSEKSTTPGSHFKISGFLDRQTSICHGVDIDAYKSLSIQIPRKICYSCGQTKQNSPSVSPVISGHTDKSGGATLSSYHEMFAEIFEKLKTSRQHIDTETLPADDAKA